MISVKYAVIMALGAFAAGSFFASPLPEAIASTIANDVICNGCVGTSDLAGNAVTAAKIKDGEVKAAEIAASAVGSSEIATDAVGSSEIAANSVGGSELIGVTKLLFGQCVLTVGEATTNVPAGFLFSIDCTINGVDSDDSAVATMNGGNTCFDAAQAFTSSGNVGVLLRNHCDTSQTVGSFGKIGIIVFDK